MRAARLVAREPVALLIALLLGSAGACSSFTSGDDSQVDPETDGGGATSDGATDTAPPLDSAGPDAAFVNDATPDVRDGSAGCGSRIACQRTVFVTKHTFTGNLGSVTGADQICQNAADTTDLPTVTGRQYIAWISAPMGGAVSTPADRIAAQGQAPYVLPSGTIVAADWEGLASGQHQHAIDVDEFGTMASVVSSHAWTGTANDGTPLGGHCDGWTSASDAGVMGHQGSTTANDALWSDEQERPCFTEARLYCIER